MWGRGLKQPNELRGPKGRGGVRAKGKEGDSGIFFLTNLLFFLEILLAG